MPSRVARRVRQETQAPASASRSRAAAVGASNPSDQQILQAVAGVPSLYRQIRGELDAYDPRAQVVVGETGVSNNETTTVCTPAGALFAAGDVLSWLAAGAQSVDWWDMNNYGNTGASCTSPDYGMFTSASPPVAETPYYGYVLASVLARPGALLAVMGTSDPAGVLAFRSRLPGGQEAVALLNTAPARHGRLPSVPGRRYLAGCRPGLTARATRTPRTRTSSGARRARR